jgi:hypothetical protein
MGNIKSVLLAAAVGAVALAPQAARAAVIGLTQTFTFASPLTGPIEGPTSSVNFFNSALGNLTSWTLDGTATATFSNSSSAENQAVYTLNTRVIFIDATTPCIGDCSSTVTISHQSGVNDLNAFTGTGILLPVIAVTGSPSADTSSSFGTFTLTYNYTPAVASVPEPSTWAMMALGFGLLGLLGYRKTRSALG